MGLQALAGVAEDLTKMSSKSAIKFIAVPGGRTRPRSLGSAAFVAVAWYLALRLPPLVAPVAADVAGAAHLTR